MSARTWRERLWLVLKILLAIILIAFVVTKTNLRDLTALLSRVSVPWLCFSFVLFCLLTIIKAAQYYVLTGRQVPYVRVLYVVIVQNAVSNFIAGGAGILSYLTMLSVDDGVRLRRAMYSFVIAKVGDLVAVWVVMLTTTVLLWNRIQSLHYAVLTLLVGMCMFVALFLAAAILRQHFVSAISALTRFLRVDHNALVVRGQLSLDALANQETGSILRVFVIGLAFSLVYMMVTLVWFYANVRAYLTGYPFLMVSFVNAFMQLISWVPIQVFGGLGVTETSLVYLFGAFGLPVSQVAALGIGLRLILYLFTLLVLIYVPLTGLLRTRARSRAPLTK